MITQSVPEVNFLLVFIEGLLAFISPCILPMLPIYLMYLSGSTNLEESNRKKLVTNTLGFILGFSIIFTLLGATASGIGVFLQEYRNIFVKIGGGVMVLFGLNYLEVINIPLLNKVVSVNANTKELRFFSSVIFGAAFSIGWTPCLGTYLGAALMTAANASTMWQGIGLLLVFSLGLGVPFLITSLLWSQLQGTFNFMKKHMKKIKIISGVFLIVVGILMITGIFERFLGLFA